MEKYFFSKNYKETKSSSSKKESPTYAGLSFKYQKYRINVT